MANIATTTMRFPLTLMHRAKTAVFERQLQGGVTRLVCDALEAYLDELDKIPVSFEIAFKRLNSGREPSRDEKVTAYGGIVTTANFNRIYKPNDHFTLTELFQHFCRSQWDERTAELVAQQIAIWRSRGQIILQALVHPPGWKEPGEDKEHEEVAERVKRFLASPPEGWQPSDDPEDEIV